MINNVLKKGMIFRGSTKFKRINGNSNSSIIITNFKKKELVLLKQVL